MFLRSLRNTRLQTADKHLLIANIKCSLQHTIFFKVLCLNLLVINNTARCRGMLTVVFVVSQCSQIMSCLSFVPIYICSV